MPLQLSIVDHGGLLGLRLRRQIDPVTQAIICDPELFPHALKNGESKAESCR